MSHFDDGVDIPEWKPSLVELRISEMESVLRSVIRKQIRSKFENNSYENKYLQEQYNKCMKTIDENKCWYFITINPKSEISLSEFVKKIQSITNWKILKSGYYVLEQRGTTLDTLGEGFHAHILVDDYTVGHKTLINRLETTLKDYCNKPYKNTINVVRKSKDNGKETLNSYMKGAKQDDKLIKVDMDSKWRDKENLKAIYKWSCKTTDKDNSKMTDGRVNNGGSRTGAGRPKKTEVNTSSDNTLTSENLITFKNDYILEF